MLQRKKKSNVGYLKSHKFVRKLKGGMKMQGQRMQVGKWAQELLYKMKKMKKEDDVREINGEVNCSEIDGIKAE